MTWIRDDHLDSHQSAHDVVRNTAHPCNSFEARQRTRGKEGVSGSLGTLRTSQSGRQGGGSYTTLRSKDHFTLSARTWGPATPNLGSNSPCSYKRAWVALAPPATPEPALGFPLSDIARHHDGCAQVVRGGEVLNFNYDRRCRQGDEGGKEGGYKIARPLGRVCRSRNSHPLTLPQNVSTQRSESLPSKHLASSPTTSESKIRQSNPTPRRQQCWAQPSSWRYRPSRAWCRRRRWS